MPPVQSILALEAAQPLVVAYGAGRDSTAVLVEFVRRGIRPDLILFADTGSETDETYAYLPVINEYLARNGFPAVITVRYVAADFKNWPPYSTLEENCLTNATLPSLAFGFKSCSLKWKKTGQDKYCDSWGPAKDCWAAGQRVRKVIGFDAGAADQRRRNHAGSLEDPKYLYWYPLQEWGWDRERCALEIQKAGLPVPPKSSCFFCPAMKHAEVDVLPVDRLRRIVILEARAKPRLMGYWPQERLDAFHADVVVPKWELKCAAAAAKGEPVPKLPKRLKEGEGCRGLWRRSSMTEYIRDRGLLPVAEVDRIIAETPTKLFTKDEISSWADLVADITEKATSCGCAA